MVQDKIVLISHIDFVISNEFHGVVEFKVFLFLVLPKAITKLNEVSSDIILILRHYKSRGVFLN